MVSGPFFLARLSAQELFRVFAYVVRGVVSGHPFDEVTGASIGRVGFFWGGSLAGVIENLKITGRIDYERTLAGLKRRK